MWHVRSCAGFQLPATMSNRALWRPAAEKRQGTKSRRQVVRRQSCGLWGFIAGLAWRRVAHRSRSLGGYPYAAGALPVIFFAGRNVERGHFVAEPTLTFP